MFLVFLSFCPLVFLSFCVFVFKSFSLYVFMSLCLCVFIVFLSFLPFFCLFYLFAFFVLFFCCLICLFLSCSQNIVRMYLERSQNLVKMQFMGYISIGPFPHSRFGHFQCPKRKSKTTFQQKYTPNQWEIWPQKPLLTTGKSFFS